MTYLRIIGDDIRKMRQPALIYDALRVDARWRIFELYSMGDMILLLILGEMRENDASMMLDDEFYFFR